jgi:hypothetical protein
MGRMLRPLVRIRGHGEFDVAGERGSDCQSSTDAVTSTAGVAQLVPGRAVCGQP